MLLLLGVISKGQQILDRLNADELAANQFRTNQTVQKLRSEPIHGKTQAKQTHYELGKAV